LKKLKSLSKTKAELTAFLAQKVMERGKAKGKRVIVAWATECKATHKDVIHLQSDHEEADTKNILHVLDAAADSATELSIYSSDTDDRRYPEMCPDTSDWISNNSPNNQVATNINCRSTWISQDGRTTNIPCLKVAQSSFLYFPRRSF